MKVKQAKLNFKFHNPNTDEETLKILMRIFTEAGCARFEAILQDSVTINPAATPKIIEEEPS